MNCPTTDFRQAIQSKPNQHLMHLEYDEEKPNCPFVLKLSRHAPKDWIPILPKREFPFSSLEAAIEFAKSALNCYKLDTSPKNIPAAEILNSPVDDSQIAFWLAQMDKSTWHYILGFAVPNMAVRPRNTKKDIIEMAAPMVLWQHAEFIGVQAALEYKPVMGLVFRHPDNDWCRVVSVDKFPLTKETAAGKWGLCNIAARLVCVTAEDWATKQAYAAGLGASEWKAFMPNGGA
jgi:hypothetical protein